MTKTFLISTVDTELLSDESNNQYFDLIFEFIDNYLMHYCVFPKLIVSIAWQSKIKAWIFIRSIHSIFDDLISSITPSISCVACLNISIHCSQHCLQIICHYMVIIQDQCINIDFQYIHISNVWYSDPMGNYQLQCILFGFASFCHFLNQYY